jgi:methyl-accepting chemotaxis protein
MTVGRKFSLTVAGLIGVLTITGGLSIYKLAQLNETTKTIVTDPMPGMASISSAHSTMLNLTAETWRHTASRNPAVQSEVERNISELDARLTAGLKEYEGTIFLPEDRALFQQITTELQGYREAYLAILALNRAGKADEAIAKANADLTPRFKSLNSAFDAEFNFNKSRGESLADISQRSYRATVWILSLVVAFSIGIGASLAFVIIRNTNEVLRRSVSELSESAQQLASAASQVSESSQSLASGSSEQAASLEETSAASEEISSMARRNSANGSMASAEAGKAMQIVSDANSRLDQMIHSMKDITDSSSKISNVLKAIDDIAFQTNILALNAAVEAARAGEAGMGFAVVADEVRNLAQRSAQAAKDTAVLIEESINKSTVGSRSLEAVAVAIKSITASANEVKGLVEAVDVGSQEQSRGIGHVAQAMTQMEQVTQRIAANAEESAAAAAELSSQSEAMKDVVLRLTALVGTR